MTRFTGSQPESAAVDKVALPPATDRIRIGSRFIEGEASGRIAILALIIITMIICATTYAILR